MINFRGSLQYKGLFSLVALLASDFAYAHAPIEGMGFFLNGVLHPILVTAHLILLIALGLFFGQQGVKKIEPALLVFAAMVLLGLLVAWFYGGLVIEKYMLVLSAIIGLLVAIKPKLALFWCVLIAALAGFSLGFDSAQETLSGKDKFVMMFGTGISIYFLSLYPMALSESFQKKEWQQIGIRVLGSWVAASSLLVLALNFAPKFN